ncbi:MAG: serine/threonine-protein phosphatase [Betaproteobacteria bacterium]|nr:serine/threonine-protein phosphatase [Betaproteobacteria bacterium]
MSMVCLTLNSETGEIHLLNCGHPQVYLIKNAKMKVLLGAGSLLGFHDTPEFDVKRYRMPPGDRIFIYTDGILENGRTAGKSISFSKLRRTLSQRDKPVFETQDAILSLFKTTWRNAPIEDDYSMILLEWVTRA